MPNRLLRDWTDSFTINDLSIEAERLFTRLIMKVDDYGRYNGDSRLVLAACFPLLPSICVADVEQWLGECAAAGCIMLYEDDRGRKFLQINNFRQQLRSKKSKFPDPAKQMRSTCTASVHLDGGGGGGGDGDGDGDGDGAEFADGNSVHSSVLAEPKKTGSKARCVEAECVAYALEQNCTEQDGRSVFASFEASGWRLGNGRPIKDWKGAFRTRKLNGWLPSQKGGQVDTGEPTSMQSLARQANMRVL